ncbi:PLP-dependent aminotransferase family protein [Candidatus Woesebacteria bacterium]|nr:PLP-dependent aminotransferase family protein [Candidatus Woesebacteria bacterium]
MNKVKQLMPSYANRVATLADTTVRDTLRLASQPGIISLGGGIPNPTLFPLEKVRQELANLNDAELSASLQYSPTNGIAELRTVLAQHLAKTWKSKVTPEHILITTGSQQALDLIAKAFLDTGDKVVMEDPSYLVAISAFQTNAPEFLQLNLAPDGPDLVQLEQILNTENPKLLYTIPTFQNPTGFTWSDQHRMAVLSLIAKSNCLIVEDDPYSELYFHDTPPLPMAARETQGKILYLGTFSKTLMPGLRIGYVVAQPAIIEKLTLVKQSMDLHSPTLSQVLIAKLLSDEPWYQTHLNKIRAFYSQKQRILTDLLEKHLPANVQWNTPEGGLFIWLKIPSVNSQLLLEKAVQRGVAFMPGYPFYAKKPDYETIRLTFATAEETQLKQAVILLGELLKGKS